MRYIHFLLIEIFTLFDDTSVFFSINNYRKSFIIMTQVTVITCNFVII